MGGVEGGTLRGKGGVVKHVSFGVLREGEAGAAALEARVAVVDAEGETVVAQGDVALVPAHQHGTHLGAGVLAPHGYVGGEGEEASIPLHAMRQMRRPGTESSTVVRVVNFLPVFLA